ncbi:MAG TPA: hypothetical protein O0X70_01895 [Methanocorpusculum sp.]|nr:hypothetical protein [Methanocorpusculum sp.]
MTEISDDEKPMTLEELIKVNHPKYICALVTVVMGATPLILYFMDMLTMESAFIFISIGLIAGGMGLFFART